MPEKQLVSVLALFYHRPITTPLDFSRDWEYMHAIVRETVTQLVLILAASSFLLRVHALGPAAAGSRSRQRCEHLNVGEEYRQDYEQDDPALDQDEQGLDRRPVFLAMIATCSS